MATEHTEIERKFDVDETFVLPDLAGVPGVASVDGPVVHELAATYYDTADLRLARARITLRRRTGGTDEGWHLKLPGRGRGATRAAVPAGPGGQGPAARGAGPGARRRPAGPGRPRWPPCRPGAPW